MICHAIIICIIYLFSSFSALCYIYIYCFIFIIDDISLYYTLLYADVFLIIAFAYDISLFF